MKLYFAPGACSLASRIAALESGIELQTEQVDLASKKTASGADFAALNPKGYVPLLVLDDGSKLTEGPAVLQYLADQNPGAGLAPAHGTLARYQVQEWLNYIGTEIHKTYSVMFNPACTAEAREAAIAGLNRRYDYVEQQLAGRDYLIGAQFTVADCYLFVTTSWGAHLKIDLLSSRPKLQGYIGRIAARPAVQAALKAEGLM